MHLSMKFIFQSQSQFDENDVDGARKLVVQTAELHLLEFTGGTSSPYNCNSYT